MSGYAPDGTPQPKERDPLLKFLGGCAIVAGALVALVVLVVGVGGWLLVRDTTPPGRHEEAFLLAGDTAYWCFDLRPDDPGLQVLFERAQDAGDRLRRESGRRSPFADVPIPRRKADLDRLFPMTVEVASGVEGWGARFTMSKQVLRLRAALRVLRWIVTRDSRQADDEDVAGVTMTTLRTHGKPVAAFAMVGQRFLVAGNPDRLRAVVAPRPPSEGAAPGAALEAAAEEYHRSVKRDSEIGWGYRTQVIVPGTAASSCVLRVVASFVLSPTGGLEVAAVASRALTNECSLAVVDAPAARAMVAALLPGIDPEAIVIADGSPSETGPAGWTIEATIPDFAKRLEAAFARFTARHAAEAATDATASPAPEPPSATPPPPSPGSTSGRRIGTPAAPPRGGTPIPPR